MTVTPTGALLFYHNSYFMTVNKNLQAFRFNANDKEVRTLLIENEPWFVAKDVCDILEHSNSRQAIQELDEDEKGVSNVYTLGGNQKMAIVNESGLYNLIFKSRKPEAKSFRKWVTAEVLPSIRKTGSFGVKKSTENKDFIDARDKIFGFVEFNGRKIRHIIIDEKDYYSILDINAAIGAQTAAPQTAKKLNAKRRLAEKIFVFGSTNPGWYATGLGMQLIIQGSRVVKSNKMIG